jgi:hypothetical protein
MPPLSNKRSSIIASRVQFNIGVNCFFSQNSIIKYKFSPWGHYEKFWKLFQEKNGKKPFCLDRCSKGKDSGKGSGFGRTDSK